MINLSAGPSALPQAVREQVAAEWADWHGLGASVAELSHRHPKIVALFKETADMLRSLLGIPENYHVLFMPGGARGQNSAVPLNLLSKLDGRAAFLRTGYWSALSMEMAGQYAQCIDMCSEHRYPFTTIPDLDILEAPKDVEYSHVCSNETVDGVQLQSFDADCLQAGDLVADMSSDFLTRAVDVSKFGIIYACAQKNAGIAGVTLVIVRQDLVEQPLDIAPPIMRYDRFVGNESMPNTPPVFSVYVTQCVLAWLIKQGGVAQAQQWAEQKSTLLYRCIDALPNFVNAVDPAVRSQVNIPFTLVNASLTQTFLEEAYTHAGIIGLKGHARRGGLRASLYNAVRVEDVQVLCDFMYDFARRYG